VSEAGAGEKTFAPTTKRRREAARNGDVLRSRELGSLLSVAIGAAWLRFAGPWVLDALGRGMRSGLSWDHRAIVGFDAGRTTLALLHAALPPVVLLGALVALAAVTSTLALGDGHFIAGNLAPKPSRLNPLSGMKRVFGAEGLIELGKGLLKVALLGAIALGWARHEVGALVLLGRVQLAGQLAFAWNALTSLLLALAAGLLAIALADLPLQWVRRQARLRMSLQEIKDEQREADGSPQNKAAIRSRQRRIAMGGIAGAMRTAQFVVTNPSHFAIAMSYDPAKASAPMVVAKGRGDKALAMRDLAAELAVPVLEVPALARSLYFTTRERQMIREELYGAIAAVLAFVMALKRGEQRDLPDIEVPLTLRYDAEGRLEMTAG
jgi:flagellar biosynthetic protein FlhB